MRGRDWPWFFLFSYLLWKWWNKCISIIVDNRNKFNNVFRCYQWYCFFLLILKSFNRFSYFAYKLWIFTIVFVAQSIITIVFYSKQALLQKKKHCFIDEYPLRRYTLHILYDTWKISLFVVIWFLWANRL